MNLILETSNKHEGNLAFRWGEESEVWQNRARFLERISVPQDRCVVMEINHGDTITSVDASHAGTIVAGEALITKEPNVFLFLLTADCFPVAFHDPVKEIAALAHMGWPPTDKQLAAKVVQTLKKEYGSNAADVQVSLGPGIHKESYVFSDAIAQKAPEKIDRWREFLIDLPSRETQVDIQGYILKQLMSEGVPEENIRPSMIDTATAIDTSGEHTHFSHYRSVRSGEPEGRFATVLGMCA